MVDESEPTLTMKYMNRFGCIGPACEEHCCGGWRIDVDRKHFDKVQAMVQFSAKPLARRLASAFTIVPPKGKREPERYVLKQDEHGVCTLLGAEGWCELHASYGYEALPHVCAVYPRKMKYIGDTLELSATASCPEVARQILMPGDGAELEPIDMTRVHRRWLQEGMDPRDTRPFYRLLVEVRDHVMRLLRTPGLALDERLFLMLWFAKRTTDVLTKQSKDVDPSIVHREIALLERPEVRREIVKRYLELETPAALALMIVRGIVRPSGGGPGRPTWLALMNGVIQSYTRLPELLPDSDDPAEHDRAAEQAAAAPVPMTVIEVFVEYQRRRDRLRAVPAVRERIDGFFRDYTLHTWFHRMPTEEQDILSYVLRTLTQQSAVKFLLYSQVHLQELAGAWERSAEAGAEREAAEAALMEAVDKAAVSVFYQMARHVEHGVLIRWFVDMLKKMNMFSAAGGVYLIRF